LTKCALSRKLIKLISQNDLIYKEERMRKKEPSEQASCGCWTVEALITVDDRGQMVLPKDVREKAKIRGGDKLALTTLEKDGAVCCLLLTKAEDLAGAVRATLGSIAEGLSLDAEQEER
jgi:antitoxin PrlF